MPGTCFYVNAAKQSQLTLQNDQVVFKQENKVAFISFLRTIFFISRGKSNASFGFIIITQPQYIFLEYIDINQTKEKKFVYANLYSYDRIAGYQNESLKHLY